MDSPIPILPLPTPDAETEKLIRMKDEEVSTALGAEAWGRLGRVWGQSLPIWFSPCPSLSLLSFHPSHPQLRRMQEMLQKMKQQMQDQ